MAPYNKPVTLRDLEGGTAINGVLTMQAPGSNTQWELNVGLWLGIMVVASIVHAPALVMLALNAALLVYNLAAVQRAGKANTPSWLYVIIALQIVVVLQNGWIFLNTLF